MERVDGRILRDFGQSRLERFEQEKHHLINLPETHFEYRLPKPLISLYKRGGMFMLHSMRIR